jgi:hypothetical protein
MSIRPLLSVWLLPSTPMNEEQARHVRLGEDYPGGRLLALAIAANDTDCGASLMAWIAPVSCTGKNPFGTAMYNTTVSTSVPTATRRVTGW